MTQGTACYAVEEKQEGNLHIFSFTSGASPAQYIYFLETWYMKEYSKLFLFRAPDKR